MRIKRERGREGGREGGREEGREGEREGLREEEKTHHLCSSPDVPHSDGTIRRAGDQLLSTAVYGHALYPPHMGSHHCAVAPTGCIQQPYVSLGTTRGQT